MGILIERNFASGTRDVRNPTIYGPQVFSRRLKDKTEREMSLHLQQFESICRKFLQVHAHICSEYSRSVEYDNILRKMLTDKLCQQNLAVYFAITDKSELELGTWQARHGNMVYEYSLSVCQECVLISIIAKAPYAKSQGMTRYGRQSVFPLSHRVVIPYRFLQQEASELSATLSQELLIGNTPFALRINDLSPKNLSALVGVIVTNLDEKLDPDGVLELDYPSMNRLGFLHSQTLGDIYVQMQAGGLNLAKISDNILKAQRFVLSKGRIQAKKNTLIDFSKHLAQK